MRTIIEFYSEKCTPCKVMMPIVDQATKKHSLPLRKVEVNKEPREAQLYNVKSVPTLIMLEGDSEIKRLTGAVSKMELENFFVENS